MTEWKTAMKAVKVGTGRKLTSGEDVAILTIGHVGNFAQEAVQTLKDKGVSAAHYDMRFAKPVDELLLHEVFSKFDKIITVEDGTIVGGMGSAVIEFMADHGYHAKVVRLGIPDKYIHHGTPEELHEECSFDARSIAAKAAEMVGISSDTDSARHVG
jgi:1-deoxy-D-xylulose-5-phosphate synthase